MRLFVALPLPDHLRDRLAALAEGLPGARWVAPENLHITLRFLGEIDGRQASDVDAALDGIAAERFSLSLVGVDCFGDPRPRSLWVGVESNPALTRLQAKVEQAVQRAGLPPERRKFKPHVTLARFTSHPGERLSGYVIRNALFRAAPFPVDHFVLFSSFLSHNGAIYSPEATYPLARGTGEARSSPSDKSDPH